MKILVFSDSHGDLDAMVMAMEQHTDVDAVVHLGDGSEEFETFKNMFNIKTYMVKGNNDFNQLGNYQNTMIVELNGKKVFITHGHMYNVKNGITTLAVKAKEQGADLVLYGHTHIQSENIISGILLINPGSISRYSFNPHYAIVTIDNDVSCEMLELEVE